MSKPTLPAKPAAALFGLVPLASFVALGLGCGPKEPPKVPEVAKPKPLEVAPEPPVDLAALPEPKNVVAVGRVSRPEEASKLFATWSGFPVPSAGEAVRAALGEELGEVLDLRGPVDMVASFEGGVKNPDVAFVVSVPVVSLEDARERLKSHTLVPIGNGMVRVEGLAEPTKKKRPRPEEPDDTGGAPDPTDDDVLENKAKKKVCVLGPSAGTVRARLVCGSASGIDALAPYALRTLSRAPVDPNDPDVHLEVRSAPMRSAVEGMRRMLPALVGGFMDAKTGVTSATRDLVEAAVGDLADFAVDSDTMTADVTGRPEGLTARFRYGFRSREATLTKLVVPTSGGASPPPAALLAMPGDVDLGGWSSGVEPGLLDRPHKLLGAFMEEALEGMLPPPERRPFADLVTLRTLPALEAGWAFGHGVDADALAARLAAKREAESAGKPGVARDKLVMERKKAVGEQIVGYTLVRVAKPYGDMSQLTKDWVSAVSRLARAAKKKDAPVLKIAPTAPALGLPAKTTHVELSVKRGPRLDEKGKPTFTPSPVVCHVFVTPGEGADADASWIGVGCDPKLVAQRLGATRKGTVDPQRPSLGARPESEGLRASRSRSGMFVTPRALALGKVVDSHDGALGTLGKGAFATALVTTAVEPASSMSPGGAAVTTLVLPKAAMGTATSVLVH